MTDSQAIPPSDMFAADLLRWFDANAANTDIPWRGQTDPYRIWLSEMMLQQTQIATVIPYYERFLARFPNVESLARAPLDDVLKRWEGLGYYSRARNLHRAAGQIVADFGGQFPTTAERLQELRGVGRYTAGAIASIVFGERVAALDGNVIRVLSRICNNTDSAPATRQRTLWEVAERLVPANRPGDYNQALMDLGRTVCTPRRPDCAHCPVAAHCEALRLGVQAERPVRVAKAPTPHYDVTAGVIWNAAGQVLIAQRPTDGLLGGLWEFPGGKQESGETLPECLQRELREELAIEVSVGELIARVKHAFTHFRITLYAYDCRHLSGEPQAIGCAAWRWVTLPELDQFAFARTDRHVIDVLRERSNRLL
jgi:A/G-specific adenine glycosylase